MANYGHILKSPGVARVVVSQLLARAPWGMLSIVVLVHVQQRYGDFTSAGTILAAVSIGQAIAGPLSGRLMGQFGIRPVLAVTSIVCGSLITLLALTLLPLPIVTVLSFLLGSFSPPVTSAVRTIYPKLVLPTELTGLFSLDAAAQELIWVAGPVLAVTLTGSFGTTAALCVCAAVMVVGGAWFLLSPQVRNTPIPPSKRGFGAVLRYPTVVICTVIGFFFVGSFSAVEAGIVAAFGHGGPGAGHAEATLESGVVLALFSAGSLLGGLIIGHRAVHPWSIVLRIVILLVGVAASMLWLNMWWMAAWLFIGGMGTAPVFAAMSSVLAGTVKFSETAEAYGWTGTGQLVGVAVGSALAGVAIDHVGAIGAIGVSVGLLVLSLIIAASTVRWIPDQRNGTIELPPETGTITLPLP